MVRIDISLNAEFKNVFIKALDRTDFTISLTDKTVQFSLEKGDIDPILFIGLCNKLNKSIIDELMIIPDNEKTLSLEPYKFKFIKGVTIDYEILICINKIYHNFKLQFENVKFIGDNDGFQFEM